MHPFHTLTALLVGTLVSAGSASAAEALTLVRDGAATSVIVTGDNPAPVQRVAAELLQYHLKKMTGAEVPIVAEKDLDDAEATRIYVGQSEAVTAMGIDTSALEPETLIVRTVDGALVLAGDDKGAEQYGSFYATGPDPDIAPENAPENQQSEALRAGTLYAVYDFLQDELGCRWLWPGPTGEVIPKRRTVAIGELDVQETPQLFMRHFRHGYHGWPRDRSERHIPRYMRTVGDRYFEGLDLAEQYWMKRMKMGMSDKPVYGHAFTEWYDRYYDQYPEIFALQSSGRRGIANDTYPKAFVKMCASSDKLVDLIIEEFKQAREENPDHRWLNAVENDGSLGFCVCEECKALDVVLNDEVRATLEARGWSDEQIENQFKPRGNGLPNALTNRYFHFYNKLARRLAEVASDAYVVTYAYSKYRYAPIGMQLEPNIMIGLIGFNNYPASEEEHAQEVSNVEAWTDAGATRMFFRPNSLIFAPAWGIPWDESVAMGDDLRMLIQKGMVATDFDRSTGHWPTAGPMYYVLARLHWDHERTANEMRDEFMHAFGPAAEPVKQYFDHWHQVMHTAYTRPDIGEIARRGDPLGGRLGQRRAVVFLLTEADFSRGRQLLAQARSAAEQADDADLLQTLHVLELGLRHGELMMAGARFAIDRDYEQPRRYEDYWPTVLKIHAVREELAELKALNLFFQVGWSLQNHDIYATRVYYDFHDRPYKPVMTPARQDWKFVPDPDGVGEAEGWFQRSLDESMALHATEYASYRHLFYASWDHFPPVTGWMRRTGREAVVNGWYQIDWTLAEQDLAPGNVLYVPYIEGSAKIWINDRLVREIDAEQGKAPAAITLNPAEIGLTAGEPFRLTIKVHSPDKPGGLIGPVYVAAPTN